MADLRKTLFRSPEEEEEAKNLKSSGVYDKSAHTSHRNLFYTLHVYPIYIMKSKN